MHHLRKGSNGHQQKKETTSNLKKTETMKGKEMSKRVIDILKKAKQAIIAISEAMDVV
jgi:hypothetical protein